MVRSVERSLITAHVQLQLQELLVFLGEMLSKTHSLSKQKALQECVLYCICKGYTHTVGENALIKSIIWETTAHQKVVKTTAPINLWTKKFTCPSEILVHFQCPLELLARNIYAQITLGSIYPKTVTKNLQLPTKFTYLYIYGRWTIVTDKFSSSDGTALLSWQSKNVILADYVINLV